MRSLLAASLALAVALHAHAQPTVEPLPWLLTGVALDLSVDYAAGDVSGTATIRVRNASARPVSTVPLLLGRLMTVRRAYAGDRAPLAFDQRFVLFADDSLLQVNAISVTLTRPCAPGDSAEVTLAYAGHLVGYTETGSLYIHDTVDTAFTILRTDAFAFPRLGVPSRAVNRATGYPPFEFDARVTVPAGEMVATGGRQLATERHDSLVTWHYRSARPSTALNLAIAPYRVRDRAGVRVFYFPQDSAGAAMVEHAVAGAIERLTAWFGPLGDTARITVIEIPEGWGSQASLAGGIIQTADAFRDRAQLPQVYHEISHLWNVEDADRPSPRWNEGLAMFLQWRLAAELDGWNDWDKRIARTEQRIRDGCRAPVPCATVPFADYGKSGLTDLSYGVGMAMFTALYRTLGPAKFDRAYGGFFQRYRASGATSAQLASSFHAVDPAGDRIFGDWFTSTRWYARLSGGEPLAAIIGSYATR